MSNIDLRFTGYANFKQVQGQVGALQKQFATLNAEMAKSAATGNVGRPGAAYAAQAKAAQLAHNNIANAAQATGAFNTQQVKLRSTTQQYVKDLQKQRLGIVEVVKNIKVHNAALREQIALQKASLVVGPSRNGVGTGTLMIPKDASKSVATLRQEIGMAATATRSAGTQMVNWGKNTQWAGRQLTVGFTMPIVSLGALSAKLAYDVDKNLTAVAKVYDTTANLVGSAAQRQASKEQELAQLRNDGLATATTLARKYGATAKETLDVQAQLAATGQRGAALQQATNEVQRLAILGQMDYQKSINATIAMQQIYGFTTKQTAEAINYMNSVENATSLSMQDFAEAIPIASQPLKVLGADIKDVGFLLTAMKERGIGAVQGANALKSGLIRLYRPSKQVQAEFAQLTGKSLPELTKASKGELIPLLREVGEAVNGMSGAKKTQALGGLFGAYQVTRLSSLLEGVEKAYEGTGQAAKALEVAQYTAAENANVANQEMARQAESASGKFKRAYAGIQIELAKAGEGFLTAGAKVLNMATAFVDFYNDLPKGFKTILKLGILFGAIVGPLVMLTGLFGNMMGMGIKVISNLALMATRFKAVTVEEAAATRVGQLATKGMGAQYNATASLTRQVEALTIALREANAAQTQLANGSANAAAKSAASQKQIFRHPQTNRILYGRDHDVQQGRYDRAQQRKANMLSQLPRTANLGSTIPVGLEGAQRQRAAESRARRAQILADTKQQINLEQKKNSIMGQGVMYAGAMGLAIAAQMQPWSQTVAKAGNYLMIVSALAPALQLGAAGVKMLPGLWAKAALASKAAMAGTTSNAGKATALLKAGASSLNLWAIGAAAAAAGVYLLWKRSQKVNQEIKDTYESADKLAEILGYTPSEQAKPVKVDGENRASIETVKKFQEAYGSVVKEIQNAKTDQEKLNIAMAQGLKVMNTGGTAEQAEEAVRIALDAAQSEADAKRIMLKFNTDFSDTKSVLEAQMNQADSLVKNALKNTDKSWKESVGDSIGHGLSFGFDAKGGGNKMGGGSLEVSNRAKALGEQAGKSFGQGWIAAQSESAKEQMSAVEKTVKGIQKLMGDGGTPAQIKLRNDALSEFLQKTGTDKKTAQSLTDDLNKNSNIYEVILESNSRITDEQKKQLMIQQGGISGTLFAIAGMSKAIAAAGKDDTSATSNTNSALAQQLALRERIADVLGRTKSGAPDFGTATKNMYQSSMTAAMGAVGSLMSSDIDAHFQSQLDGLSAAHQAATSAMEARSKAAQDSLENRQRKASAAFEARQKKAQDAFDARWKKKKDALQKEEDLRQRIFDAEAKRIERMKELNNTSVDYRVAVASGDLDAAAKIRNDSVAQQDTWALEDSDAAAKAKAEAAMKKLEDQEAKEKAILDRRQAREKAAFDLRLQREKAALDKSLAAQKANLAASQAASQAAAQRQVAINKAKLQAQLEADLAYIPTTEGAAKAYIDRLVTKYQKMGINLKGMSLQYGRTLHDTLLTNIQKNANELKTKIDWAGLANSAASKYVKSIWGMSLKKFLGWVDVNTKKRGNVSGSSDGKGTGTGVQANHGGGLIGNGGSGRAGYAAGSGIAQSEKLVLAQKGEYMVKKKVVDQLGREFFDELNGKPAKRPYRTGGSSWNMDIESNTMGSMMNLGTKRVIKEAGEIQKAKDAAQKAMGGSTGASMKGVDPNGWNRPWKGHYSTSNGHDYPLSYKPIYAPHSGSITAKAIPGYEPRVGHGGRGYKSYGKYIDFNGGGTNLMFAHLSKTAKSGKVRAGQYIGTTGETGNAHGPHVHVERNHSGNNHQFGQFFKSRGVSLRKGGTLKYDNTLVNGHKGETMLTENLTNKMKEGFNNFATASAPVKQFGDIIVKVPEGTKDPVAFGRKAGMEIKKVLDYEEGRY